MNADVKTNILSIALETKQLELERARMQLEDQNAKEARQKELDEEKTGQLVEEISFIKSQLYRNRNHESVSSMYEAVCEALEILDPGDPRNSWD